MKNARAEREPAQTAPLDVKKLDRMKHDILTPMGTIKGLTTILGMSDPLTHKQQELINTLKATADDLHGMIENVFEFVQSAGTQPRPNGDSVSDGGKREIGREERMAGEKPRILVVDDYPPNLVLMTNYLEQLGYDHDTAQSGFEALEKLAASRYAVLMMDLQMPDMDGLETTRQIRRREKEEGLSPTPILGATANATDEERFACLRAGMDDCFSKRFEMEELKIKLDHFIQNDRRQSWHKPAINDGSGRNSRP